jgi:hypothetical protein
VKIYRKNAIKILKKRREVAQDTYRIEYLLPPERKLPEIYKAAIDIIINIIIIFILIYKIEIIL